MGKRRGLLVTSAYERRGESDIVTSKRLSSSDDASCISPSESLYRSAMLELGGGSSRLLLPGGAAGRLAPPEAGKYKCVL